MKLDWKEIKDVQYIEEPSFFINCFEQKLDSYNPAHWLMKLGAAFEIGRKKLSGLDHTKNSYSSTEFVAEFLTKFIPISTMIEHPYNHRSMYHGIERKKRHNRKWANFYHSLATTIVKVLHASMP